MCFSLSIYSKAHEPFVYNDLKPYFDTNGVEKAIYEVKLQDNNYTCYLFYFVSH